MRPRVRCWRWRAFDRREEAAIDRQMARGRTILCPACGALLEARPTTRLAAVLPGDVRGYDLDCRGCRKFRPHAWLPQRSRRLLRLRRLAAAVLRA